MSALANRVPGPIGAGTELDLSPICCPVLHIFLHYGMTVRNLHSQIRQSLLVYTGRTCTFLYAVVIRGRGPRG